MKAAIGLLTACIALHVQAAGPDNRLAPQETAAGWKLLFDGKTFANWDDPTKKNPPGDSWGIEDGCLKALPHPRINEDLFSLETYGDFELEWDWRISRAGNSGVKYRIQDRIFLAKGWTGRFEDLVNLSMQKRPPGRPAQGQEYVIGFEFQMIDNQANRDALSGATHSAAALYDMIAPTRDATKPVGEFNRSRLVVRGKHIEHWLNGEKVLDDSLGSPAIEKGAARRWGSGSPVYELLVKQPKQNCLISLQNHGDEAWFKNIRIRRR